MTARRRQNRTGVRLMVLQPSANVNANIKNSYTAPASSASAVPPNHLDDGAILSNYLSAAGAWRHATASTCSTSLRRRCSAAPAGGPTAARTPGSIRTGSGKRCPSRRRCGRSRNCSTATGATVQTRPILSTGRSCLAQRRLPSWTWTRERWAGGPGRTGGEIRAAAADVPRPVGRRRAPLLLHRAGRRRAAALHVDQARRGCGAAVGLPGPRREGPAGVRRRAQPRRDWSPRASTSPAGPIVGIVPPWVVEPVASPQWFIDLAHEQQAKVAPAPAVMTPRPAAYQWPRSAGGMDLMLKRGTVLRQGDPRCYRRPEREQANHQGCGRPDPRL